MTTTDFDYPDSWDEADVAEYNAAFVEFLRAISPLADDGEHDDARVPPNATLH
jgi:hypothetical protein